MTGGRRLPLTQMQPQDLALMLSRIDRGCCVASAACVRGFPVADCMSGALRLARLPQVSVAFRAQMSGFR